MLSQQTFEGGLSRHRRGTHLRLSPGSAELPSPFHSTPGQSPLPNEGASFICWRIAAVQWGQEDRESFTSIDSETSKEHPTRKARALAKGTSQLRAERSRSRTLKSYRLSRPIGCLSLHHLELVQEDGIEQGHPSGCCLYSALCWAPRRKTPLAGYCILVPQERPRPIGYAHQWEKRQ